MPADRPRAWQYMGDETPGVGHWVEAPGSASRWERLGPGDLYIAHLPLTPDDIPLTPPVEVTAEDVETVLAELAANVVGPFGAITPAELARVLTERLAARRQAET